MLIVLLSDRSGRDGHFCEEGNSKAHTLHFPNVWYVKFLQT